MENENSEVVLETEDTPEEARFEWLPERLERARTSAVRSLLDDIGVEDVEHLKTTLDDHRENLERLAQLESSFRETRIEMAFRDACRDYSFHNLEEVRTLADFSGVEIDESGTVTGIEAAIESLVAERPHLVKRPPVPSLDVGDLSEIGEASLSPQKIERVKKKFRL